MHGASDDVPEVSYEEELTFSADSYESDYLTSVTSCDDPDSPALRPTEPSSSPSAQYIANEIEKMDKADKADQADKIDQLWDTIDASDWDDVAASLSAGSQNSCDLLPAEIMPPNSNSSDRDPCNRVFST